jgi:glucose/arabinose dehydrogenase
MLYLGFGDGGSQGDPSGNGQDLSRNFLGSIIRIDVRDASAQTPYAIPGDNPFASRTDGTKRETWAYGMRNPWRFSFDRATGALVVADVGQGQREEIDVVEGGKNYGWNVMEGKACYKPGSGCDQQGLTLPVLDYTHEGGACSVTGGFVYRGAALKDVIDGAYVFADYCSGIIGLLPGITQGKNTGLLLHQEIDGITTFGQDQAGEVYALAEDGKIYRLSAGGS